VSSKLPPQVDFRKIRSIMETPILDERKWAKVPGIAADAFMIDLEDSVVPAHKDLARSRAVQYLNDTDFFNGKPVLPRPNNLATPWGRDDLHAIASADPQFMVYPKARSAAEVAEVQRILADAGARPLIFPIIETAAALLDIRQIAALDGVGGVFTGIGDLSVDAGLAFWTSEGEVSEALRFARNMVVMASAAFGRSATDAVLLNNIKDEDELRAFIEASRRRGFTSLVTFYPPHVALINELFAPSAAEIDAAEELISEYEAAQRAGKPAVILPDGRTAMLLDYTRALRLLAAADREHVPAAGGSS
jgi:citrate lyase beta subunit